MAGHLFLQSRDRLGVADPRHHVLSLGVDEVVAVDLRRPVHRVAGEGYPGSAVFAHVAEHHRLDVHRGAEVVADAGGIAVVDSALAEPAVEDRPGGEFELFVGILGKLTVGEGADDTLETLRQFLPISGAELGVVADTAGFLDFLDGFLEGLVRDPQHHRAEHLDEAAIGVVHEALVPGKPDHAPGGVVVQARC